MSDNVNENLTIESIDVVLEWCKLDVKLRNAAKHIIHFANMAIHNSKVYPSGFVSLIDISRSTGACIVDLYKATVMLKDLNLIMTKWSGAGDGTCRCEHCLVTFTMVAPDIALDDV